MSQPPIRETDLDRILKLVPTEQIVFYSAAVPLLGELRSPAISLASFVIGTLLVPLILYVDGQSTSQPSRWPQYVIRTLAFVAWACAIAWPFGASTAQAARWIRSFSVLIIPLLGAWLVRERPPGGSGT